MKLQIENDGVAWKRTSRRELKSPRGRECPPRELRYDWRVRREPSSKPSSSILHSRRKENDLPSRRVDRFVVHVKRVCRFSRHLYTARRVCTGGASRLRARMAPLWYRRSPLFSNSCGRFCSSTRTTVPGVIRCFLRWFGSVSSNPSLLGCIHYECIRMHKGFLIM